MSSEEVTEIKAEEATETVGNEIIETANEEQPTEQIKQEETVIAPIERPHIEQPTAKAKPKGQPKKPARSVQ